VAEYRAMEAKALEVFAGPVGLLEEKLVKSPEARRKSREGAPRA
jgi:hypothetical protein